MYIAGPTYCTAYHRLVTGEQEIFCDELNYQVKPCPQTVSPKNPLAQPQPSLNKI